MIAVEWFASFCLSSILITLPPPLGPYVTMSRQSSSGFSYQKSECIPLIPMHGEMSFNPILRIRPTFWRGVLTMYLQPPEPPPSYFQMRGSQTPGKVSVQ